MTTLAGEIDAEIAQRHGFDAAERRVVLGDGAPWIWNLAGEQFPGATEIVDIYHARQHLSDVAKALYGPGTDRADAWARQRTDELDAGRLRAIVAELRSHTETTDAARRCLDYVVRNRRRMRCPRFRAQGLCVSSGVVEAGCKQVVGARLKPAGPALLVAPPRPDGIPPLPTCAPVERYCGRRGRVIRWE